MAGVSVTELVALFCGEVTSYIPLMRERLARFAEGQGTAADLAELHRLYHNVKSAAAHADFMELSKAARKVESCLATAMDDGGVLDSAMVASLQEATFRLEDFVRDATGTGASESVGREIEALIEGAGSRGSAGQGPGNGVQVDCVEEGISLFPLLREMTDLLESGQDTDIAVQAANRLARGMTILHGVLELGGHAERYSHIEAIIKLLEECSRHHSRDNLLELAALTRDGLTLLELSFSSLKEQDISISPAGVSQPMAESEVLGEDGLAEDIFGVPGLDEDDGMLADVLDDPETLLGTGADTDFLEETLQDTEDVMGEDDVFPAAEAVEDGSIVSGSEIETPVGEDETFDDTLSALDDESDLMEAGVGEESSGDQAEDIDEERQILLEIFRTECDEHLITCNESLNRLESVVLEPSEVSGQIKKDLATLRRSVHTLKGAAAMTGIDRVARGAHSLEDALDRLHDESPQISPAEVEMLAAGIELLETLAETPDSEDATVLEEFEQRIRTFLSAPTVGEEVTVSAADTEISAETAGEQESREQDIPLDAGAPLQEDVLGAEPAVYVEGEEIEPAAEDDGVLPAESTTLRVRLGDLDELVSIEGELVVARGALEKMVDELVQSLAELETVKDNLKRRAQELEVGFEVQSLYGFSPGGKGGEDLRESDLEDFDPIELDRYSQLNLIIRSLNEISVDINAIHSNLTSLSAGLGGQINRQQLTMRMMQEKLLRIRMTPLSSISRILFRTVRETARNLGKRVGLTITGEDVYMDRVVWAKMTDPLMHILRNCVDHGIEDSGVRELRSKPKQGNITIKAEQHSRHVILTVSDDGGGVDLKAVRNKVRSLRLSEDPDRLSEAELLDYLFHPSFSTRDDVSSVSGRGVGLDVVRKNIQELRGSVKLFNHGEKGVSFVFQIPFTLSVNRAVLVSAGGQTWAIPLQDVRQIKKVSSAYIEQDDGLFLHLEDRRMELVNLGYYLQLEPRIRSLQQEEKELLLILFGEGERQAAVYVDEILEQREIVVKNLGSHLTHVQGVAGVTFTGTGGLIPILNLTELTSVTPEMPEARPESIAVTAKEEGTKVLIVDDSISVRHNVARLVESLSWQQQQAVDGVDALAKLESYQPDVIVLDIEMPRMNGYEFKSHLNNQESLRDIPVVMLTSRASEKHRQKAMELGIQHYMTKPYEPEDFARLLKQIEYDRRASRG